MKRAVVAVVAAALTWTVSGCFELDAKIDTAKTERARLDLKNFESALQLYKSKRGAWPTKDEGLAAVQRTGILIELPKDPWNRPYLFDVEDGVPVVKTLGQDGLPGGKSVDADLKTQLKSLSGS